MLTKVKHYALELLPPILVKLGNRLLENLRDDSSMEDTSTVSVVSTPEALDGWIEKADAAGQESDDALRRVLTEFRYQGEIALPEDPFSPAYVAAQWELYRQVSGNSEYNAEVNEQSRFDFDSMLHRPFPYSTLSCQTVGNHMIRQGLMIKYLGLPPHSDVLEFGSGWGNLTLSLARMGHRVTAVEISSKLLDLIGRRSEKLDLDIKLVHNEMLTFESKGIYDAVVFFEAFHHCSRHLNMLERLHRFVKDDGVVLFGFEPITPDPDLWGDYPWGVRMDGISVWSTRKFGWLELGFTEDYFLEALRRTGWVGEITYDTLGLGSIVRARKS
jgi:SAM-dependent methyltransferase